MQARTKVTIGLAGLAALRLQAKRRITPAGIARRRTYFQQFLASRLPESTMKLDNDGNLFLEVCCDCIDTHHQLVLTRYRGAQRQSIVLLTAGASAMLSARRFVWVIEDCQAKPPAYWHELLDAKERRGKLSIAQLN